MSTNQISDAGRLEEIRKRVSAADLGLNPDLTPANTPDGAGE
jgi:hypothetical protein